MFHFKNTHRKYCFRVPDVPWDINWLENSEVEDEFCRTEGKLISLPEATNLYYNACVIGNCPDTVQVVDAVITLGILGYARSIGYRVDLFPYLIFPKEYKETL